MSAFWPHSWHGFHRSAAGQTIPMETYLRSMFLKMRYQLGYETLVTEVTDSVGGGASVGSA